MRTVIRRLSLGFVLIALSSAVLLLSDWRQRKGGTARIRRVAIVQHASQPVLDDGVRGMLDALAAEGFIDGRNIAIQRFNAENDLPTANTIARQVTTGEYDMVITSSTLSMQTVANANKAGRVIHVFGVVADPFSAGIGISRENPLDHPKHLVGLGSMVPVDRAFQMARAMYPGLKSVGLAWNSAESNSLAFTTVARKVCKEMGLKLMEANVESSSAVLEAATSLVARGAQALWVSGDVTVLVALESVVAAARKGRIPVFTITPPGVQRGSLFDSGVNFYEVGEQTGELAASILKGADPAKIPVRNLIPEKVASDAAGPAPAAAPETGHRIDRKTAGFEVFDCTPNAKLECAIVGDPALLSSCGFRKEHSRTMTFPESAMAIGLGAFGHHFEDCEQRFGEFLSVAGAAAYQPTDGSNVPDYLIAAGSFVPGRSPLEPHYPSETWAPTLSRISNE